MHSFHQWLFSCFSLLAILLAPIQIGFASEPASAILPLFVRSNSGSPDAWASMPEKDQPAVVNGLDVLNEDKVLSASDLGLYDAFGTSVVINGNTLAVGAPSENLKAGSVYLFERDQGGIGKWGLAKKIVASDPVRNDKFGSTVILDGDTLMVGAVNKRNVLFWAGVVYVFERNQGGAGNWGEVKKLQAPDPGEFVHFGSSISLVGDTLMVGAPGKTNGELLYAGAVYLFGRNQGGSGNWGMIKKLLPSTPADSAQFGTSVSLDNDTLVVGAAISREVYIFERNQGGTGNWGEVKKLLPEDSVAYDYYFGSTVNLEGDTLVVGAGCPFSACAGAVYVFDRSQGGIGNWGLVKKIVLSDPTGHDYFGFSIGLDGDRLVVGASNKDNGAVIYAGQAYIFERNQGGTSNWGEVKKLLPSDPFEGDSFGRSVAISGEDVFVGAPGKDKGLVSCTGVVYTFALPLPPLPKGRTYLPVTLK